MKMTRSLSARLNGWYLDDGSVGDVLEIIGKVLSFCEVSGLSLNPNKCEVFLLMLPQQRRIVCMLRFLICCQELEEL